MNGIYAPKDNQLIDHHTLVTHEVAECQSEQDYKGIMMGASRGVFNGRILVAKHAMHTKATQSNKNLLLSKNAEMNTKPELDIFADDVICSHGATVGQLDKEALFYLASRGIPYKEAERSLISAFLLHNLERISNKELSAWLTHLLNQQLG